MQIVTSAGKERLSRCSLELKLSQKCREEGTQALRPLWVNHTAASVDRPEEVEPYKDGRGLHNTFLTCQSLNEKIIWHTDQRTTRDIWTKQLPASKVWTSNIFCLTFRSHGFHKKWILRLRWHFLPIFMIPWGLERMLDTAVHCVLLIELLLWWPINCHCHLTSRCFGNMQPIRQTVLWPQLPKMFIFGAKYRIGVA